MSLNIDLYGHDRCIFMWNPDLTYIWYTTGKSIVTRNLDYGSDLPYVSVLFLCRNLNCLVSVRIAIMVDKVSCINLSPEVDTKKASALQKKPRAKNCDLNGKIKPGTNYYNFSAKNNHIGQHVDGMSNITKMSKSEQLSQGIEKACREKADAGTTSTWRRRDSFSSCSSDSAGYCSSGNAQIDAQDVKTTFKEGAIQKKRQRHSSESSALSSASDTSNRGATSPRVNELLSCLEDNLTNRVRTESIVSKHSSITHYPSTISQSEVSTIVEEKTLSYTCKTFEKSPPSDEKQHNLRRQIRKKTCHNCDCSGSHTTVVYRKFTQIKRATTTTTKPGLPKVSESLPKKESSISSPASPVQTEELESNEGSFSTPSTGVNKKRRREIDKLYDALHEIKWAKHMSPDNILSQIDFRRAATDSFYSSKSKTPSELEAGKIFKSPQTMKGNHLTKDIPEGNKIAQHCCNDKQNKHITVHPTVRNDIPPNRHDSERNIPSVSKKAGSSTPVTQKHGMSLRSFLKGKRPRNGYHLRRGHKNANLQPNRTVNKKHILNKTIDSNSKDTSGNMLSEPKEKLIVEKLPNLSCNESFVDLPPDTSNLQLSTTECNMESHHVDETNASESVIVEEIWTNEGDALESVEQLKDIVHFECGHEYLLLSPLESSCPEGEVVFAYLDPLIEEVETTIEMTCQEDSKLTSATLPLLKKVAPVLERSSEQSPPHLELCIDQPSPCLSISDRVLDVDSSSSRLPKSGLMCKTDSSSCVTLSEVNYVENIVSSNNVIGDGTKLHHENKNNMDSKQISIRRKPKCKVFSRSDYSKKKKLVPKYFSKSKTRLKTVVHYTSPTKTVSQVIEEDHSQESVIPKAASPNNIVSNINENIPTLNEEDCNALIKNDSLRVHLRGLDHVVIRDHLERYNHMVSKATAHQSIMCTRVETSGTDKNEKRTEFCAKKEVSYNRHYSNDKSTSAVGSANDVPLPLEYKKTRSRGDMQFPYTFTFHYRCITVNKSDCYTQIIFKLTNGQNTYLSIEALKELKYTLNSAVHDDQCQVLIMNSAGQSFCSGLDLRPLVGPRKNTASKEMAIAVKEFIEALAAFCKPLVVVVNGEAMGLGVTLLAYSDVILASEAATFHMPYSQLGFSPEGAATLMLPFVVGSTVAMDMMLRGRKLSAYEAQDFGLISEVLSASRLPYKLVERVQQLAENPRSAMENTKSMLRMHLYHRLGLALESETALLPNQWLSDPCQSALRDAFNNGLLH